MDNNTQIKLPLVYHKTENELISQRVEDGYVNATAMCKAAGKEWSAYYRNNATKAFINELSTALQISQDALIQSIVGGLPDMQGTWVHPQVAIHLAQWLSPKFSVLVTQWVMDWMTGKLKQPNLPYHLRRYMANMPNVPNGYFSMLNEVTLHLIGPLESLGYTMPANQLPDGSLGRMFSEFLKKEGYDIKKFPKYNHTYENGFTFPVRAYPNDLLGVLRKYFVEVWLKERARDYFAERDVNALPYLEKMFQLPNLRQVMGYIDAKPEYKGFDKDIKKALDYNPNEN